MAPVEDISETIPSDADISRIAEFCTSMLDDLWCLRIKFERVRPPIKLLLPGMRVPRSFLEAIGLFWFLADFEDAQLFEAFEPPLPTIECLFGELRQTLQNEPKKFWTHPKRYHDLAERTVTAYRRFDWQRFDEAPIATDRAVDEVFIDQLVDVLLSLPDAPAAPRHKVRKSWEFTAVLPFQLPKPKKHRFNELILAYGPPEDRHIFTFRPRNSKELRADYDYIVAGFAENGIELELTFEEFCAEVRPRRSKRRKKRTDGEG